MSSGAGRMVVDLKRGITVFYISHHGAVPEEGIVKQMHPDGRAAWVLYHTGARRYTMEDLDNYTAALTNLEDLYYWDSVGVGGWLPVLLHD